MHIHDTERLVTEIEMLTIVLRLVRLDAYDREAHRTSNNA
jgi:hypothetical protein